MVPGCPHAPGARRPQLPHGEAQRLKAGRRSGSLPFPEALRAFAVRYAEHAVTAGGTVPDAAPKLGMSGPTLRTHRPDFAGTPRRPRLPLGTTLGAVPPPRERADEAHKPNNEQAHHVHERSRGVGLWGSATAWGSTPRQPRWPLRRGQLRRPRGQPQVLHNGAHPTRSRQVPQHPPPAPTPLATEDVEAQRPPEQWRLVHSRLPLLLRLLAGPGLRRHARLLRSCLGEQ